MDARERVGAETFRGQRKTSRKKIPTLSGVFHFSGQDIQCPLFCQERARDHDSGEVFPGLRDLTYTPLSPNFLFLPPSHACVSSWRERKRGEVTLTSVALLAINDKRRSAASHVGKVWWPEMVGGHFSTVSVWKVGGRRSWSAFFRCRCLVWLCCLAQKRQCSG